MVLAVNLDDEFQRNAAEVDGVGRDGIFATKLLSTATSITKHLPNILRKLVHFRALLASETDRFCAS
jgi:hypothetical protein